MPRPSHLEDDMSYGSGPAPYGNQPPYGTPNPHPPNQAPYGGGPGQFGVPTLSPDIAPLPGASFGEAIKRFFQRYAQFRGYASRSEFWWPWLVNFLIGLILSIFTIIPLLNAMQTMLIGFDRSLHGGIVEPPVLPASYYIFSGIMAIYGLAILLPALSSQVRRLHDIGKPGTWIFIALIPLVGPIWLLILLASESRPDLYRPEWN